jgi:type IV pilus assembly protein PilE
MLGFTLIELMIVIVIVAILAAIALPGYQSQIRKSRRSDAIALMSQVQQAQERWRSNNAQYAASMAALSIGTSTSGGYYTLATAPVGGSEAVSFTITATGQGSQTSDSGCQVMRVSTTSGTVSYMAGAAVGSLADASTDQAARRCWNR